MSKKLTKADLPEALQAILANVADEDLDKRMQGGNYPLIEAAKPNAALLYQAVQNSESTVELTCASLWPHTVAVGAIPASCTEHGALFEFAIPTADEQ